MKKFAFTMAEIVVSLVVMAVIASVVVPITRDKFEKVDYASYYLGYRTAKEISTQIVRDLVKNSSTEGESTEENGCTFTVGKTCFSTQPVATSPLSKSECLANKDAWGIKDCYYYDTDDYWGGAVKACGGVHNMPTSQHLANLAKYLYNLESVDALGCHIEKTLDLDKVAALGFPKTGFSVWSDTEQDQDVAYYRDFQPTFTCWDSGLDRDIEYRLTLCVGKDLEKEPVLVDYIVQFCEKTKSTFATSKNNCTDNTVAIKTAADTKDFSALEPNLILNSGLKVYLASDFEEISILNDSIDEDDRIGFMLYIDVDGNKSKSRLYDDVFPFYLTKSGKVIPGYDSNIVAGANCEQNLAFDVLYDEFDASGNRKLKRLDGYSASGADEFSFKTAACVSGYVKSQKYCGINPEAGVTVDGVNCYSDSKADCRIRVRKPLRIFN